MKKERLKLLRKILGFTQEQMAKYLHVARSTLAGVERGFYAIGEPSLQLLKEKLGINPDWLEGKNVPLFLDLEKGLATLNKKTILTRYELVFLLEVMQSVWSKIHINTKKEFILNLIDCIEYILKNCQVNIKEIGLDNLLNSAFYGKDVFDSLENAKKYPATTTVADILARALLWLLRDGSFEIEEKEEKAVSEMLVPWGYYVAKSDITIKKGFKPVSSVGFENDIHKKEISEISGYRKMLENVFIEYEHNKFIIHFKEKAYLLINKEKAFAFFVYLLNLKKDTTVKVLDFEFSYDSETEKLQLTQSNVTLLITKSEFESLLNVINDIQNQHPLWQYLQKMCLEEFGFV